MNPADPAAPTAGAAPMATAAAGSVLIVDDQLAFRRAAATLVRLVARGAYVREVVTGEDAVAAVDESSAREQGFDAAIMDINLPGISGIEATRAITRRHPGIKVLLVSTYAAADLPTDAATCGAVGYLRKEDITPELLRQLTGLGEGVPGGRPR